MRTHRLAAQPLTAATFAPFGLVVEEPPGPPTWGATGSRVEGVVEGRDGGGTPVASLWALGDLSFAGDVPYLAFVRYHHQGFDVAQLERHPSETQTWLAVDGVAFLVVAPATAGAAPPPESAAAFLVTPGQLLAISRGVWMCHFFPVGAVATFGVITARREPEQDRDLVDLRTTADTVLRIVLADDR